MTANHLNIVEAQGDVSGIVISLSPCGGNGYYDPVHQICQPYLPADPQAGYDQTWSGGYYDPAHGVCAL